MRRVVVDGAGIDGGPTVFTMRWVFEGLLRDDGYAARDDLVDLRQPTSSRATPGATAAGSTCTPTSSARREAIARIRRRRRGRQATALLRAQPADLPDARASPSSTAQRPSPLGLDAARRPRAGSTSLLALRPWQRDVARAWRLSFATRACGNCSVATPPTAARRPFRAPATLMLVAHVEQEGVWLVRGGMHEVAPGWREWLSGRARCSASARRCSESDGRSGRATGVELADGERIEADAVVFNGDCRTRSPRDCSARPCAQPCPPCSASQRSLSAVTWCVHAPTRGLRRSSTTTCSSPRITARSSRPSSAAARSRRRRPSTSARRIAAAANRPARGSANACCCW